MRLSYLDPEQSVARTQLIVKQRKAVKDEDVLLQDGRVIIRDYIPIYLGDNKYGQLWTVRDVTERRETSRQLRDSARRFHLALAHAPVTIAAQDCNLRFIWAYNHLTNQTEVIGKTDFDIFAPDDARHLSQLKRNVIATGDEHKERIWITVDGRRVYWELFLEPLKNEAGGIEGVATATVDLTDIKIAEDNLQHSKERFEILSEANSLLLTTEKPEKIVQTIAEKVMLHLNCDCFFNYLADDKAKKLKLNAYAGIPESAAQGISWLDYGQAICGCAARDGCRLISENIQQNGDMRAALVRSFGVQAYACHPLKAGLTTIGTLSFGTRTRAFFTEDEIGLMKTVSDQVSVAMERKLFDEHLSQVVQKLNAHMDNSPLAVVEFDPQFRVIRWSREAEKIFGWNESEILGKAISDIRWVYQEDVSLIDQLSVDFANGNRSTSLQVNRNYRKDGTVICCEWYNSSIYDSDGKLTSVLSQILDITERKKAEEAIQRYALELEKHRSHLEEMVRERTSELQSLSYRLIMVQEEERRNISRELHDQTGQSLTVLNMLLGRALRSPENASSALHEAQQMVKEVLSQVRNLSSSLHPGMLEDLGLLPTLNWYFNDFDKKTGILIHFKHEGLETPLPPDVNITVYRIIQEGLTNIARYAEVSEAEVTIILDKKLLRIKISDKGKGFDITSSSAGLGLRGMKERANSLNGDVKITSSPGAGTVIEVELSIPDINS